MTAKLVERLRPAVLHAASNHANARVALALRETYGLPVVYEVRGFWEETWLSRHESEAPHASGPPDTSDQSGSYRRSDFYRRSRDSETTCMREADLVVTLGEVMRDEIVARGVPENNVIVVPNAVSAEFLQPLPDGGPLRAKLGIEEGEFVVGLVSSLVAYEGIGTLLQAAAALRDRGVPVRPLIVGDGPERTALERQAAGLGVPTIFTGRVPIAAVRNYHAILDIFVVPRTNDRVCQLVTPLKPVEAMASGLCVVTSEVKALTEIIKHEVTGALTIPQDPVSLADTLEYLLYSPDIRQKLGANAREWVAGDRTWVRNAERYREAYARVT
jgi:glycosyltransferase involved in cell wall biosynthesis